tara:strand:+ start:528 stop:641 length:114 start_codon:yes stop_codon:yes gene_type:complete
MICRDKNIKYIECGVDLEMMSDLVEDLNASKNIANDP